MPIPSFVKISRRRQWGIATIDNMGLAYALGQSVNAGLDLGEHAAGDRAVLDQPADLRLFSGWR